MKKKLASIQLVQSKQDCNHCDARKLCLALGIDEKDISRLNSIIKQKPLYEAGEYLYRRGDRFKSLYVVQRGAMKSQTSNYDGDLQVTGFYFPGDLIGIDSIAVAKHPCDVIAIKKSWVCELPYDQLEKLCTKFPVLQHELVKRLSHRIFKDEYDVGSNRNEIAEKRVLGFLIDLYLNPKSQEYIVGNKLVLPMTKSDLSSYLRLRAETLSRTLKKLQQSGYINNEQDYVEILDVAGMKGMIEN